MKGLKFVEINSEIGAGTRGASLGMGAMKVASLNIGSKLFFKYHPQVIQNENQLLFEENETPLAKRVKGIVKVYNRLNDTVSEVIKSDYFPVVMAGDHSTAGGTIAGLKSAFPEKRIGVIWIDAHADLHTPYTTPSGNVHGMPLATAVGTNNEGSQINHPDEKTTAYWDELKNIGGISPKIIEEDLIFVAVRDTEGPEDNFMSEKGIKNFSVAEVREIGVLDTVKEILNRLENCDLIYISFDVDSMDCEMVSKGTGTPVKDGLSPDEATEMIKGLLKDPKVMCFEIVEVNPCLDHENKMGETAFEVFQQAISVIEENISTKSI